MPQPQYLKSVALLRDKVESFDAYPFRLPAVRSLDHLDLHPKVTYFVGENGSGKSTLLEAITVSLDSMPRVGRRTSDLVRVVRIQSSTGTFESRKPSSALVT